MSNPNITAAKDLLQVARTEETEGVVDQQTAAAAADLEAQDHNAERAPQERAPQEGRLDPAADPAEGRR